jgi:hypothetical protein
MDAASTSEGILCVFPLPSSRKIGAQVSFAGTTGSGLRLMECVRLRIKHLDVQYGNSTRRASPTVAQIDHNADGKGQRDRGIKSLLELLCDEKASQV